MKSHYDCIIVGGGPGGATCAIQLGKKNHRVLLLDKESFPRDKTCGDALSSCSLSILNELGIDKSIFNMEHYNK